MRTRHAVRPLPEKVFIIRLFEHYDIQNLSLILVEE